MRCAPCEARSNDALEQCERSAVRCGSGNGGGRGMQLGMVERTRCGSGRVKWTHPKTVLFWGKRGERRNYLTTGIHEVVRGPPRVAVSWEDVRGRQGVVVV